MRFQKRIKLLPGLTLNLSKRGVSTSIGVTGARMTFGHGQKRTTVGLPGTGLSHTVVQKKAPQRVEAETAIASSTPQPASLPALKPAPGAVSFGRTLGRLVARIFGGR